MSGVIVVCDFRADFRAVLAATLGAEGFLVDTGATLETLLENWLRRQHRRVDRRPRAVEWSTQLRAREPTLPPSQRQALGRIEAAVHGGDDMNPYFSRHLASGKALTHDDAMLNELGIQHMHLGLGLDARGMVNGTKELLFVLFSDGVARFIDVFDHGSFVDVRPFEIAQANWPELFERWKFATAAEPLTAEQRTALRKKNANALITAADGTSYLPPGGGSAASGISSRVVIAAAQLLHQLETQERWCRENGHVLAERLEGAGRGRPTEIHLRFLQFEETGTIVVADADHGARFHLELAQVPAVTT